MSERNRKSETSTTRANTNVSYEFFNERMEYSDTQKLINCDKFLNL